MWTLKRSPVRMRCQPKYTSLPLRHPPQRMSHR